MKAAAASVDRGRPPRRPRARLHHPAAVRGGGPAVRRQPVTFAIFFLVPRLAGATPETWRPATSAAPRTRRRSRAIAEQLGFYDPSTCSTAGSCKGIVVGADYDNGPTTVALPGAVPRLLVPHPAPGLARPARPAAGHALAGRRRRDPLAGRRRRASACSPRCAAGTRLRPGRDERRPRRRLAADLLHRPAVAVDLQLRARASPRPAAATRRSTENPLQWAYDLILPWITLAFLFSAAYARLTRAGMLETMGEDYIRTARAKGLPERTVVVKHGLRSALTPIVTHLRPRLRPAARRRGPHREHVLAARPRQVRRRRDRQQRPAEGPRGRDRRRLLRRRRQPGRRPPLRRRRPEGEDA